MDGGARVELWGLRLLNFETRAQIDDAIGLGHFAPDPGYVWLLFNIALMNRRPKDACVNWLLDHFVFVSEDANQYGQRLVYNDAPGHVQRCYGPQQQSEGYVVFEVPIGTPVRTGRLQFQPADSDDFDLALTNIVGQ